MASQIKIERKENGKWMHVDTFASTKPAFMDAFEYVNKNAVGVIVSDRHCVTSNASVWYFKTTNSERGFDFKATITRYA